jgi:hypothetical protein
MWQLQNSIGEKINMARPRVFVSSTYYDLKHIRASLENFIESLGFDAILSEKGGIAYDPELSLDESCYREVGNADIFVLLIGGRYGTEASENRTGAPKTFYELYDSITKKEYTNAVEKGIPVYILIERTVYSDYETYLLNKDNAKVTYAHVNSVNVFSLIESILNKRRNNPFQQFDRFADIQSWLREQWAGLFRELLTRKSSQQQISSLAAQVSVLTEVNKTLKTYLEQVLNKVSQDDAKDLIRAQDERLRDAESKNLIDSNKFLDYVTSKYKIDKKYALDAIRNAKSAVDLGHALSNDNEFINEWHQFLTMYSHEVMADINMLRHALGLDDLQQREEQNNVPKEDN